MNVLQINAVYKTASTGRTCYELESALIARGDTCITAFGEGNVDGPNSFRIGNDVGQKLHAFLSRALGLQGYFSSSATRKLIKFIKKYNPDIVHLRNLHANYINIPMILKYLGRHDIATVVTLHDCFLMTGKCTHYINNNCYKWQTGCGNCPRVKNDNKSWFFDRTSKMWADKKKYFGAIHRLAVVGVSDWITNEAKKSFLQDAKIIKRIYNWIDLSKFYPRDDNMRSNYGIEKNKFIVLLISAGWSKTSSKFSDMKKLMELCGDDICFAVAGSGLDDAVLPANVVKVGYIDGTDELAKLYSMADVYVHLSRADTFGKVIAEAMACGTPVIVYNTTALPEVIGDNCGEVAELGAVNIYNKLCRIKHNGKAYYTSNCVNRARALFSAEKNILDYIGLYKDIMKD